MPPKADILKKRKCGTFLKNANTKIIHHSRLLSRAALQHCLKDVRLRDEMKALFGAGGGVFFSFVLNELSLNFNPLGLSKKFCFCYSLETVHQNVYTE